MMEFDKTVEELKPNRCRCRGKAILKQDKKTQKYFVICRECLTRTEKFESAAVAVEVWNNSAGKKVTAADAKKTVKIYNEANRKYFCQRCGAEVVVKKNDNFCHECGYYFERTV